MRRRRYLRGAAAGVALGLAGCTGSLERTLYPYDVEEDPEERHLIYRAGGEEVATVSLIGHGDLEWSTGVAPIRLHVWHVEGSTLERVRYVLRAPDRTITPDVYLKRPGGYPWGPISFVRGEAPGTTELRVPDLGEQGRGSVTLDLLVTRYDEDPFTLEVDVDAGLDGPSFARDYRLRGTIEHRIPAAPSR